MKKTPILVAGIASAGLLLGACSGGGSSDGGDGSGSTMRLALNQTEEHPSYIALDNFGQALEESTDGRWGIDVFPNETLGAQAEALQLVSDGSVDMAVVSGAQLENLNADFTAYNLPKVFTDIDHQMQVINNPGELTSELFASLEESNNLTVIGGLTQGSRSVYTTFGAVESPADLAGKKMRVQESDLNVAIAEALGAAATPMAYGELYTGLQSGVVDAAENNEVSYFTQKHFEVAPYFSYTNHVVGLDYVIINTDKLESMTDEDRAAFDEGWAAAWAEHTELWTQATQDAIDGATAGGATFTEVDDAAFSDALAAVAEEFIKTDNQQALYDNAREGQ
ncbi:DctP family TRAP transporter solute-binding subunit [Pseudactinotalea sp. HY158]|nr:DctP family TRAP transporter solute-binding subunit [Pseudactinotalea sp. HY158]